MLDEELPQGFQRGGGSARGSGAQFGLEGGGRGALAAESIQPLPRNAVGEGGAVGEGERGRFGETMEEGEDFALQRPAGSGVVFSKPGQRLGGNAA